MKNHALKISAVLCALLFLYACSTSVIYISPDEKNKITKTTTVVVRTADGDEVGLHSVRLANDRIVGLTKDGRQKEINLSTIQAVMIKKTSSGYAVLYGAAAGILAWLVIGAETAPPPPPSESCPFIYSFDGQRYVFEAEPYGGAICRGLQRSEWIGLDHLRNINGLYKIQIANMLEETEHTDELKLVVLDHPPGVRAVADGAGKIHALSRPLAPLSACDKSGRDVLPLISGNDWNFWESRTAAVNPETQGDLRDELTVEFPKPVGAKKAKLVANAWTTLWGSQVAKRFLELYGSRLKDWTA